MHRGCTEFHGGDGEIAQAEEEVWERDPVVQVEMREECSAYLAGDYATIDEYIARQRDRD